MSRRKDRLVAAYCAAVSLVILCPVGIQARASESNKNLEPQFLTQQSATLFPWLRAGEDTATLIGLQDAVLGNDGHWMAEMGWSHNWQPPFGYAPVTLALINEQGWQDELEHLEIDTIIRGGTLCGQTRLPSQLSLGFGGCPFDNATIGLNVASRNTDRSGDFELHGSFARNSRGAFTLERQMYSWQQGLSADNSLLLIGFKGGFLEDRVQLTTERGWSNSWQTAPARAPITSAPLNEDLVPLNDELARLNEEDGTFQVHGIKVKLLESKGLNWTVTGQLSDVSDYFYPIRSVALQRPIGPPGKQTTLASSLKLNELKFRTTLGKYNTGFGMFNAKRIGVSYEGISLDLKQRSSKVEPSAITGNINSRTDKQSLSLHVDLYGLSPILAAQEEGLAPLLPKSFSVNWDTARTDSIYQETQKSYRRKGWEIFGIWDTPLGDTTLGYRWDTKDAITVGIDESVSHFIHASHSVSWRKWRFGLDGMVIKDNTASSAGYESTTTSIGGSITYASEDGPEFSLRVGRDGMGSGVRDGSFVLSDTTSRITAKLDLSKYLQKRFERKDLHLTAEYRMRLGKADYQVSAFDEMLDQWSEQNDRHGFLLRFSTRW